MKTTQKELRALVKNGQAVDITRAGIKEHDALREKEGYFSTIAHAAGVYGCNGLLLKGSNTGTLYAITARTTAIYLFN